MIQLYLLSCQKVSINLTKCHVKRQSHFSELKIVYNKNKKSRIRETLNLSNDADRSTDTFFLFGGQKKIPGSKKNLVGPRNGIYHCDYQKRSRKYDVSKQMFESNSVLSNQFKKNHAIAGKTFLQKLHKLQNCNCLYI